MTALRLEAFKIQAHAPELVASTSDRVWMDMFPERHAYRCLPLTIANAHCWELLAPGGFEVTWNGSSSTADLTVRPLEDWPEDYPFDDFARSHFSRGIVTLHTGYVFRTPPEWSLLATGPFNEPRIGITPLTGIMESDWLPYPFTMNWQMLISGSVQFQKDETFCAVMPIPKNYLPAWEIAIHDLADDPVLWAEQATFGAARDQFMQRMRAGDTGAIREAWQRHYFVGRHPDGTTVTDHTNRLRLATPQDLRGTPPRYMRSSTQSPLAAELLAKRAGDQASAAGGQAPAAELWRQDSILNELNHDQDVRNQAGRARLNNGILTPSQDTFLVAENLPEDALDFVLVPDFLSSEECALLAEAARAMSDQQHKDDISDAYWKDRIVFFTDVASHRPDAAALMRRTQDRVTERLSAFYGLLAPIYADTVQLVQWREGMSMPPHADRAYPDGSSHPLPHRDFASIVYLNDDYRGGELYFPRLDIVIRPKPGMLVAFTAGWHHEHAVLRIGSGLRLTMPAFYTFNRSRRDQSLYR